MIREQLSTYYRVFCDGCGTAISKLPGASIVVGLILIVILVRFVATSLSELRDNWNSDRADQGVFLQLGLNVKGKPIYFDRLDDPLYPFLERSFGERDGFATDGARNPLFPLLLSSFAERTWDYFTTAKLLNVALGTLVLIIYFLILRSHFDEWTAILATGLLAVNHTFIWHTAAVVSEPLLMVFLLLTWHFTATGFKKSISWIAAGIFAGLVFLTKGSGPALVAGFIVTVAIVWGKRATKNVSWLLYLFVFFIVATPYLVYSYQVFGNPLHNYNYTHALWMDRTDAGHVAGTLPTMGSYLASHDPSHILAREWRGLVTTKNLLAYGLLPQGLEGYFRRVYATVGLVLLACLLVLFRKRVKSYVLAHTEIVVSAGALITVLLLPFTWFITYSTTTRYFLPLFPILLALGVSGCLGIARWILDHLGGPHAVLGRRAFALIGLGAVLVLTALKPISDIATNPFQVDREKNEYTEHVLNWLSKGVSDRTIVMYGTSHLLPRWKYTDHIEFITIPSDIVDWDTLYTWCEDKGIDYAIIDTEMMTSRLTLLEKHFEIEEGRLAMKDTPPGWVLTYAYDDMPAGFLIFEFTGRSSMDHPLAYELGDHIALLGYRLDPVEVRPGQDVHLTLYWKALKESPENYTVFTHLLDEGGQLRGQVDTQPLEGVFPTSAWQKGMVLADRYDIPVSPDAPPGEYQIACGMYNLETMKRLEIVGENDRLFKDHIRLQGPQVSDRHLRGFNSSPKIPEAPTFGPQIDKNKVDTEHQSNHCPSTERHPPAPPSRLIAKQASPAANGANLLTSPHRTGLGEGRGNPSASQSLEARS